MFDYRYNVFDYRYDVYYTAFVYTIDQMCTAMSRPVIHVISAIIHFHPTNRVHDDSQIIHAEKTFVFIVFYIVFNSILVI